jgi:rhodanese-related sulfurtransferase
MSGLGEAALRSSQDPIILHVRRPGYHADFAHWVLFLGSDGPTAHLLDPPGNAQDVPIAEIMAVWDGVGVVVTSGSWSGWEMKCGAWVVQGAILLGLAIATKAIRRIRWFRVIPQSAFLVVPAMALGSALAYHGSLASGFLRSPGAVGEVIRRNYEIDLPIVSAKDVSHLLSRPDVIIIDCRLEPAFRSGHIPGAVNLSVMANTWERLLVLDKIPMASQLIVYCQSDECEWAGQVAGDLFCRGFGNIAIFRGGWIGWKEYEHAPDFGR